LGIPDIEIQISGNRNLIISADSSFFIKDYHSFEWESFQKIKKLILEK